MDLPVISKIQTKNTLSLYSLSHVDTQFVLKYSQHVKVRYEIPHTLDTAKIQYIVTLRDVKRRLNTK